MINEKTVCLNLIVTQKCNLNCVYCQSDKSFSSTMDFSVSKKYVDIFLQKTRCSQPTVAFLGGEPFMAFKLLMEIVEYVKREYPHKSVRYSLVTNGTLVHGAVQKWIKAHADSVQVVLSLDSLGNAHDKNRCGSLRKIDIDFFVSLPKPIINTVLTPSSVGSAADDIKALHEKGFLVKCYLEDGGQWSEDSLGVMERQLVMLVDYYLKNPEVYPITMLNQSFYMLYEETIERCGTEDYFQVSVTPDGAEYACHRCAPFENHGSWKIPDEYLTLLNAYNLYDKCDECFLSKICNTCPASNALLKNNAHGASIACGMRKLFFKANAYMYVQMVLRGKEYVALKHLSKEQMVRTMEVSNRILDELI